MEKVKITMVKSLIGSKPKQRLTAAALGLKKIGDVTVQVNDAVLAGKIKIVSHLVTVENV